MSLLVTFVIPRLPTEGSDTAATEALVGCLPYEAPTIHPISPGLRILVCIGK